MMKIYGDYTFLLDKLNVWNNSQVRTFQNGTKIVEFADKFIEEQRAASQDQVSISREGMEYMISRLSDIGSADSGNRFVEENTLTKVAGGGLSLMDGLCRTYILQRLDGSDADDVSSKLYNEMASKYKENLSAYEVQDITSHAESLAKAHMAARDKILEGYANGTREVWTLDSSSGDDFSGVEFEIEGCAIRYRKLSQEEELGRLEKTFEELVENVASHISNTVFAGSGFSNRVVPDYELTGDPATDEATKAFWDLDVYTSSMVDELKELIRRIEEEEAKKKKTEELSMGDRLALEQAEYRETVVARGNQQAQYANYRKMSQMMSDAKTLLGNIRA